MILLLNLYTQKTIVHGQSHLLSMYVYVYTCNNTCIKIVGTSTQFLKKYFRVTLKELHSFLKRLILLFTMCIFVVGR